MPNFDDLTSVLTNSYTSVEMKQQMMRKTQLTLIFLKTLLLSGSVTISYTASGGNPISTLALRLQREPLGTLTCQE
jgi:hypothetical protein